MFRACVPLGDFPVFSAGRFVCARLATVLIRWRARRLLERRQAPTGAVAPRVGDLTHDRGSTGETEAAGGDTGLTGSAAQTRSGDQRLAMVVLTLVSGLQLASGALFAGEVHHQAFDEPAYAADIERFRVEGVNRETLRAQVAASGPLVTVVAGLAARLAPGDVRAWRIPVILSWLVVLGVTLLLARRLGDPAVTWSFSLFFAFPHVPTAIGSVLTEGPTMAGLLVAVALTSAGLATRSPGAALLAGLGTGVALLCRQYSLAFAVGLGLAWLSGARSIRLAAVTGAGPLTALALLFLVWGGLLSPSFKASGGPELHTRLGLNLWRPISAATYVGLYLAPLLLTARPFLRWRSLVAGAILAVGCVALRLPVLGNGPVLTLVKGVTGGWPLLLEVSTFIVLVLGLGSFLLALVGLRPWLAPNRLTSDPLLVLSIATVVAFVLQQLAVGGNNPFFERYILVVSPFFSLWGLRVGAPSRGWLEAYTGVLVVLGQFMLWRHA